MAINFKSLFSKKNIALFISVLLNILGGTGTIDPIVAPTPAPVILQGE